MIDALYTHSQFKILKNFRGIEIKVGSTHKARKLERATSGMLSRLEALPLILKEAILHVETQSQAVVAIKVHHVILLVLHERCYALMEGSMCFKFGTQIKMKGTIKAWVCHPSMQSTTSARLEC